MIGLFIILIFTLPAFEHPEQLLLGKWKEVEWHYDKVDRGAKGSSFVQKGIIADRVKSEISGELFIHQAEEWSFQPGGYLVLKKENEEPLELKWYLKGRGHILKLRHPGNLLEFYQIRKLTQKELVLNFENDLHARGIIEIRFERISD